MTMLAETDADKCERLYTDGTYLSNNPTWHVEDSPWKAQQVLRMLSAHGITPTTVCEVGCGAGEVLNQLHQHMGPHVEFVGYEISPQAYALAVSRAKERLTFALRDSADDPTSFDVVLAMDVVEHVEDYFTFLRRLREKGRYKILHIPLDIYALSAVGKTLMRGRRIMGHIHYFTRATALAALEETGYTVIDVRYTWGSIFGPRRAETLRARALRWARRGLYHINQELTVRLVGGSSILVLAT